MSKQLDLKFKAFTDQFDATRDKRDSILDDDIPFGEQGLMQAQLDRFKSQIRQCLAGYDEQKNLN